MRKGIFLHTGLALLWLLVGGCASTPDGHFDARDPLESYNRKVHRFNQAIDDALLKPVAKGYKTITPEPVDRGITNFFNNLWDISSAVNNLLQFKLSRAGSDVGRLAMNSTIGLFGFFDVATNMGFPSYKEDFGQTFGYWGDDASPYLVLPFLGPSTLRDMLGLGGDILVNPLTHLDNAYASAGLTLFDIVDTRSDLLSAGELVEEAAFDPYVFIRDAYLQRRCDKIFDGRCPSVPEEEDMETDEAADDDAMGRQRQVPRHDARLSRPSTVKPAVLAQPMRRMGKASVYQDSRVLRSGHGGSRPPTPVGHPKRRVPIDLAATSKRSAQRNLQSLAILRGSSGQTPGDGFAGP